MEKAQAALSKACHDMTHYADFHRRQAPEYKVGDKVWLSTKNLNVDRPSCKLTERQLGPYEIVKIISSNAVKLKLTASFKIHNVINVSCVRPYRPPVAGQSIIPPEPVTVEGTPEYEVEEIMDSQLKRDKLEFLVKWSGYTDDYNTWKPEANCYGTASCLISSHLINHASPILSNELSNTSVWLCYGTAPQPLILSL